MSTPVDYTYFDKDRVFGYLEQLDDLHVVEPTKEVSVEVGTTGFKTVTKTGTSKRTYTNHEATTRLEHLLVQNGQLDYSRPTYHLDSFHGRNFVSEVATLSRFVLRLPKESALNLSELVVWTSDPYPDEYDPSLPRWEAQGTFLVLVANPALSEGGYSGTFSGHSALFILLNECFPGMTDQYNFLNQKQPGPTPREIFAELGSIELPPRQMKVLYKKRCISNEQYFLAEGEERRCNLLIGYPLYIREVFSPVMRRSTPSQG